MPVLVMPRGFDPAVWEVALAAAVMEVVVKDGCDCPRRVWRVARGEYERDALALTLSEYRGEPGTPVFYRGIR